MNQQGKTIHLPVLITTLTITTLTMFSLILPNAFADDSSENDFIAITTESIKNNPALAKILENIEKSKNEFADSQHKTNQDIFIDEQRQVAKSFLEQELEQMFKDNEEFTSVAAFKKFLKNIADEDTKTVFQDLFDYQQNKVNLARNAMYDVLRNGGTIQEARDAYHDAAKIPRTDMIQLVQELNIQVGFSDAAIQNHFDENGKLPRYDNEQESIVSFVDLTSSAKNINSSANSTENTDVILLPNKTNVENKSDTEIKEDDNKNIASQSNIIQELLKEIQVLKNKIKELENNQEPNIQKLVFDQKGDSLHFADWVSDYVQGLAHNNKGNVDDKKSIPVNVLNKPNSYNDVNNSLALGRQGQVTIGFSESVTDKLIVYEASTEKNIREMASVEVSPDGENWFVLTQTQYANNGSYVHEYSYDLSNVGCITHVRITDKAPSVWGDGFDVDAVGATKACADST